MENGVPSSNHHGKRRGSNSHTSMSDADSDLADSWHSATRSDEPENDDSNSRALVLVANYYSPVPSPRKSNFPASSPAAGENGRRRWPESEKPSSENIGFPAVGENGRLRWPETSKKQSSENDDSPAKGESPVVVGVSRLVREEATLGVKKMEEGRGGAGGGKVDEVGAERRSRATLASILKRSERDVAVRRAALALRVFEVIVCLVSFSVMAADKTQGWSGDSFDRYREYRYCLSMNVIGFAYSCFQAFDLAYHLVIGKHLISHHLRYHFDFAMDQILAYLLMSASSAAATRVDEWVSNWGGDKFTLMASASIAMSFLAFIAFALSSLVSGYNLCDQDAAS